MWETLAKFSQNILETDEHDAMIFNGRLMTIIHILDVPFRIVFCTQAMAKRPFRRLSANPTNVQQLMCTVTYRLLFSIRLRSTYARILSPTKSYNLFPCCTFATRANTMCTLFFAGGAFRVSDLHHNTSSSSVSRNRTACFGARRRRGRGRASGVGAWSQVIRGI